MTIEERAEKIVRTANSIWFCPDSIEECVIQQEIVLAIKVATEQDSIARKEERERCVAIITQFLEREYAYNGNMATINPELIDMLCKVIEEGKNNDN